MISVYLVKECMGCCFVVYRNGGWATQHNSLLLLCGNSGDRLN